VFAAIGCGIALLCLNPAQDAQAARPNIILMMADDLGYGHLGSYGQTKILTPHLDRMAAEGMRYTQAYSGSSVCAPSRSVLMTGLHTGHTPVRWNTPGTGTILDEDITIAERLQDVGYRTGGFGKWGLGKENMPGHPNLQGFDQFFGQYSQVHAHFYYPYWLWHNRDRVMLPENENGGRGTYVHDITHEHALKFIRTAVADDVPFFAYLPYVIPHVELIVPEDSKKPYEGKFLKHTIRDRREGYLYDEDSYTAYAGMISRLDDSVGDILAMLDELKIDEETLFVFTSDNGAQGSHWKDLVEFFEGTGGLRASKGSLYEGGIRVPLIVRWPGKVAPGQVVESPIVHYDLPPTLIALTGAEPMETDGVSLLPQWMGQSAKEIDNRRFLFWQTPGACAVRSGNWKLIRTDRWMPWELYDLSVDPQETSNLADQHRDVVYRLSRFAKSSWQPERENVPTGPRTDYRDYVR
tara:strand:+ start:156791 stop:158188 length:1398 start_codon:yes stop_codon:yes gene_type:complete